MIGKVFVWSVDSVGVGICGGIIVAVLLVILCSHIYPRFDVNTMLKTVILGGVIGGTLVGPAITAVSNSTSSGPSQWQIQATADLRSQHLTVVGFDSDTATKWANIRLGNGDNCVVTYEIRRIASKPGKTDIMWRPITYYHTVEFKSGFIPTPSAEFLATALTCPKQ